ncbi:hypothetical protein TIFTF001_048454 [Ficus carica]|uniref:DUF4283 domain-containing protein n=1 Tax=Ficus carica TaxID=3494 RepID=A0AA87ZFQ2_FICCA|nr:hypothetical protein TIFTF001_048452 [Ficus carica]GMN35448.1 hypothetical protein TIFTF001_048454 [Ficus carica]
MEEMLGRLSSFSITEEEAMVIGISDEVIDRDMFLFSFEKEQDRAKVLAMEPWSFNKSLLIMKAVDGNEALRWDRWSFTCFWIRVYNLPYDGMIREIGEKIGNGIGKFIDVVTDENGRCPGIYMRLRVQIDVSRPLRRGATVQLGSNDATVWTSFKYERVPDFCFGYGRIGHGRLECADEKVRNMKFFDRLLYSSELRADIHLLGPEKSGGDRREGNGGRRERSGESYPSMPDLPKNPTEVQIVSKDGAEAQEPRSTQIPNSGDSIPLVVSNDRRDLGVSFTSKQNHIPLILGNILVGGSDSFSHVGNISHFNKTVSFGERPLVVGSNVNVLPPRPELGVHGTIHVERQEDERVIFSAGVVEPVKRSVGKWKKEARLKDCVGRSGGLALLWRDTWQVRLRSSSRSHIDIDVISDLRDAWQFTGFYGPTKKKARRHAWELLKHLRTNLDVPWICGGDFNEVLNPSEVDGGGERSLNDMLLFRETLDLCDLVDMGYVGPKLTWDNRRSGSANIQVRLDRFVANTSWRLKYRRANVVVLDFWGSDHRALLLQTMPSRKKEYKRKSGGFRFEPLWAKNEECPRIVEELWQNLHFDGSPNRLASGLTSCAGTLRRWGLRKFGNIPKRVA